MRILAAAALALVVPTALVAQSTPQSPAGQVAEAGAHARLADALASPAVRKAALEAVIRDVRTVMLNDPAIIVLEKECDGLVDRLVENARPMLTEYEEVESAVTRTEMIALFRDMLTEGEAGQLADFYESANGQKLIATINANLNFEQTIAGSISNDSEDRVVVEQKDFEADTRRAIAGSLRTLSSEEIQEIGLQFAAVPAFAKMLEVNPKLSALRVDIANRDLIPGFDERINALVQSTVESHMASCDASGE